MLTFLMSPEWGDPLGLLVPKLRVQKSDGLPTSAETTSNGGGGGC